MTLTTIFRVIAFLEGLSYILLLFIAVPIKYINSDPQYVKMLGMPHGLLFMGYIALAIVLRTCQYHIYQKYTAKIFINMLNRVLIT